MKNISLKGILLGMLAIVILDIILGIALIPIFGNNLSKESAKTLLHENGPLIFSMIFGTISTVVGGFVTAKYGKVAPYKNSVILGIIGILFGIIFSTNYPFWFNVFGFLTTIPASLLGAYFIARKIF